MKTFLVPVFLGLVLVSAPMQIVMADDTTTSPVTGSGDTTPGNQSGRGERLKEALAELNLTDAQKAQIKQIRDTMSPGKERRQQIMAVLTPDQKQKLLQMLQQFRSEREAANSGTTTSTSN